MGKIIWLSTLQPLPTPDQRGMIPFRTNVILILNSGWRLCLMDAVTSALGGCYLSAAILKRNKAARVGSGHQDLTLADVQEALKGLPFEFRRRKVTLPDLLTISEGIFICLISFLHPDTKITDKHHVVIDCYRKIILDNSESNPFIDCSKIQREITVTMRYIYRIRSDVFCFASSLAIHHNLPHSV